MTRLQELRNKMGMNMKEFASYLNVKYTTYAGYENGTREPGSDFLVMVAKKCGTTTDWLLELSDEFTDGTATIIDYDEAQQMLRIILTESEYTMLRAFQAADDRAREDAYKLLEMHRR